MKLFVVVYLCIECWACLPIHVNKIVKQNILAFIYLGESFCDKITLRQDLENLIVEKLLLAK